MLNGKTSLRWQSGQYLINIPKKLYRDKNFPFKRELVKDKNTGADILSKVILNISVDPRTKSLVITQIKHIQKREVE